MLRQGAGFRRAHRRRREPREQKARQQCGIDQTGGKRPHHDQRQRDDQRAADVGKGEIDGIDGDDAAQEARDVTRRPVGDTDEPQPGGARRENRDDDRRHDHRKQHGVKNCDDNLRTLHVDQVEERQRIAQDSNRDDGRQHPRRCDPSNALRPLEECAAIRRWPVRHPNEPAHAERKGDERQQRRSNEGNQMRHHRRRRADPVLREISSEAGSCREIPRGALPVKGRQGAARAPQQISREQRLAMLGDLLDQLARAHLIEVNGFQGAIEVRHDAAEALAFRRHGRRLGRGVLGGRRTEALDLLTRRCEQGAHRLRALAHPLHDLIDLAPEPRELGIGFLEPVDGLPHGIHGRGHPRDFRRNRFREANGFVLSAGRWRGCGGRRIGVSRCLRGG